MLAFPLSNFLPISFHSVKVFCNVWSAIRCHNVSCRLYWCLIEFIDWRYSQSFWYSRPCELLPLLPSLWFTSPTPPPFPKVSIFRQCVAGRGWGGM